MRGEAETNDLASLTRETQELWERKADFWDAKMGEGNPFHRVLISPAVERLLAPQPGETFLDVACGNGQFSRRLAQLGAQVVATDFSATFLDRARVRTTEHAERIDYRLVDATDEAALLALGTGRFDGAVCNMALMDMTTIAPLLRALAQLIKPGGRFVFTVPHPALNSNATRLALEEEDRGGELYETRSVRGWGCPVSRIRTTTSTPAPRIARRVLRRWLRARWPGRTRIQRGRRWGAPALLAQLSADPTGTRRSPAPVIAYIILRGAPFPRYSLTLLAVQFLCRPVACARVQGRASAWCVGRCGHGNG